MIRFRFTEDERRFVRLHAEMFEKLARAGLSEVVGSDTLRNVSKIEQMAFLEGIRQGLAMAGLASASIEAEAGAIPEPLAQKAFQLHALIYGSSDTPLRAVEKEWLSKLDLDADHLAKSWLDDKPMRFAPATLQELDGTAPPIAPMVSIRAASKPVPVKPPPDPHYATSTPETPPGRGGWEASARAGRDLPPPEAMHGAEVTPLEPWQKGEYEPDDPEPWFEPSAPPGHLPFSQASTRGDDDPLAPVAADDEEVQPESPEFLDIARSEIQAMKSSGWDPKTWQDIILGLHRKMGVDAGYLDIQLTTPVGRAVLDQCGLMGLAPGAMATFDFIDPTAAKSLDISSLSEPGEGTMGFGKAHDWKDEI